MRRAFPGIRWRPGLCVAERRSSRVSLVAVSSLLLVSACAGPEVRIRSAGSELAPQSEAPETVNFYVDIAARGYAGKQLVLEVTLLDRDGRPLRSNDRRYENRLGYVAVGRTLMIWSDADALVRQRLSLPLSQVPMPEGHWPSQVRYCVYDNERRVLAEERKLLVRAPEGLAAPSRRDRLAGPPPAVASGRAEVGETTTTRPVDATRWMALIRQVRSRFARILDVLQAQMRTASAQQPACPATDESTGRIHIVVPGDTLTGIADRYLGDANRWLEIFDLNRDRLVSPELLRVGQALMIPEEKAAEAE